MNKRNFSQGLNFIIIKISVFVVVGFLFFIIFYIFRNGISSISMDFLTKPPTDSMTRGGIFPAIVGTFCLSIGALIVAVPIGIISAVYLSEYAKEGVFLRILRLGIRNLAGVPSIVFGLFGLALFVIKFGFGSSLLSGSLTLGFLILPTIIAATEEALKGIPQDFREASLALGATKVQTIFKVVLPAALSNIVTGILLSVGRVAGETAPIMFTAAAFYKPGLPTSVFDEVMALPYHIYTLATEGTHFEQTLPIQYGTCLVLLALVVLMDIVGIWIRLKARKSKKW